MSNFIELSQINGSSVSINTGNILYLTPTSKLANATTTSIMLIGGVIIKVEEEYKMIRDKINE